MEEVKEETNKKEEEFITDFDIYDDLDDVNIPAEYEKLKRLNEDLLKHTKKLEIDMLKVTEELTTMKAAQETLKANISELFNTAKNEIERKNKTIADLRSKLDDFVFRRNDNKRNLPEGKSQENKDIRVKENERKRPHSPPRNRIKCRNSEKSRSKSPKKRRSNSPHDRYKSRSSRHSPNRSSSRRTPNRKSPTRRSPNRRSPNRKSPGRKSPNRKSPGRKSPNRKSPGRKSPNRKSPGRKSPSRRSPNRKSPSRKSLHSRDRDGTKRNHDQSRRDERYNGKSEEFLYKTKFTACGLDRNDKTDKTFESIDKTGIKVEENCDKKVDTNLHSVDKNLIKVDRTNLQIIERNLINTKPAVTVISDILVKSQTCLETVGNVKTEEDNQNKIKEETDIKVEECNTMLKIKTEGEKQIIDESSLYVSSSTDNIIKEFKDKLMEPDEAVITPSATTSTVKRRRRCVVKSIV